MSSAPSLHDSSDLDLIGVAIQTDRQTDKKTQISWWALSWENLSIPEQECLLHRVEQGYCLQLDKEVGLVHTDKQEGRVYGIELGQGDINLDRSSHCRGQSSGWKHLGVERESYDRRIMYTLFHTRPPKEGFAITKHPHLLLD